jgi:hypothetical protein
MITLDSANTFILPEEELRILLEASFYAGALSHADREGQHDTCWSNVEMDKKENCEVVIQLFKALKSNNQ